MAGRKRFSRRGGQRKIPQKYYSKTKKMVTGQSPTLLENIASGVGSVAQIAKAVLPAISMINTEAKYWDTTAIVTAYAPGTNDSLVDFTSGIIPGTGDSDRIGNSVLAKNIQLKMALNFPATLGSPNVMGLHCRFMIFCWKENATQNPPTVAKLFEVPTNIYSPLNKDYSDQMVILKDKFFTLESQSGVAGTAGFTHMKYFKDLNWHLHWQDGSGSPTISHIFGLFRSSSAGATNAMGVTYYSRMNYTDN